MNDWGAWLVVIKSVAAAFFILLVLFIICYNICRRKK